MEPQFLDKVSKITRQQFLDELALVPEISASQQLQARNACIVKTRALQKDHELDPYPWKLPAPEVLDGSHLKALADGEVAVNYENGTPALRGTMEKHQRVGQWEVFFPNGQKYAVGAYKDDQKDGIWQFFGPKGELKMQQTYEDGHLVSTTHPEPAADAAPAKEAAATAETSAAIPADSSKKPSSPAA
jgi:hypothetical protein